MRRFAKLTRGGAALYVDPALVGLVGVDSSVTVAGDTFAFKTEICDRAGETLVNLIDQDSDEVYRRLASAGEVVTKEAIAEAEAALNDAFVKALAIMRSPGFLLNQSSAFTVEHVIVETLAPFRDAVKELKRTVLAALWVAEGENPNG